MKTRPKLRAAPIFPHSASPKPKHRLNYNDDYPGDVAPHKASHESSLPSVQDEEEESSSAMSEPTTVKSGTTSGQYETEQY